jgi:RNA polymerase sigma factor (TIGR02999 family)
MLADSIPHLLQAWRQGDQTAYDRLFPLVYAELRRLARAQLRREHPGHSLQPTVLVHEVYLRLVDAEIDWRDRTHFLSVAARVMRRILVEHARAKSARKRGGAEQRVTLTGTIAATDSSPVDVLVLDGAMERLRTLDARQADVVELSYFGGLTYAEIGEGLRRELAS